MNRIFTLFLLLFNISNAQNKESMYHIDLTDINVKHGVDTGLCTSETYIKVVYKGGKDSKTVFYTNDVSLKIVSFFPKKYRFTLFEAKKITLDENIDYIEMFRRVVDARNELFSSCCNCRYTSETKEAKRNKDVLYCKTNFIHFGKIASGDNQARADLEFKYRITPIHTLASEKIKGTIPNAYIPIGTKVKLLAKKGFPSELYNYQYSKTRTWDNSIRDYVYQWENLPQSTKSDILSVSAEDIFGSEVQRHIGKKVYFRVVSFDKDRPNEVCSSSNIIPLEVTVSAPKVKEYRLEQPRCPEDNGGVQMFFDRELYPDEKISISVVKGKMFGREFMMELPVRSFDNDWFRANYKDKKITISNLPPLTNPSDMYQVQIRGEYHYGNDIITMYSDGEEFNKTFRIEPIPKLTASVTKFNNLCYGEELGAIFVNVSGGTPPYRYTKDGTTTDVVGDTFDLRDLAEGIYSFTITDSNGCSVLDDMGQPKVFSEMIETPSAITIVNENEKEEKNNLPNPLFFKKDVSGFGLKNGEIRAIVTGGSPFLSSDLYEVTLTNRNGVVVSSLLELKNQQDELIVHYNELDKGDYTLTIKDMFNCILTKNILIEEPDPLVVSLSEKTPISCNPANDDPNNDANLNKDGELYALVQGGRPPYQYQWYRMEGAKYQKLFGQTASTLKGLAEGVYRVDIKDKKNNTTTGTFSLKYPEQLTLTTQSSEIGCSAPTSGVAKALPQGGTPPYTYQWSDGQTTPIATGLSAGKYFVVVSDSKGCSVQSQVVLSYPEQVTIDSEQVTPLTCYGDDNASIVLTTSGGKGSVTHTWYDASGKRLTKGVSKDGRSIRNLVAGVYKIVLRDQGDCPAIEKSFEIVQPQKQQLLLPNEVTICQGDSYTFDLSGQITNATYRWTDALGTLLSTEASLSVHLAGDYYVEATTDKGCKAYAKTSVKQSSQVLALDFLVATTSYYDYTLKLINLSQKTDALQWQFPENVIVVNQNNQEAEVRFPKEGIYRVGLKGSLGECYKVIEKQLFVEKDRIGVEQYSKAEKNVKSFLIVPNPNSGSYQLHVKLHKPSPLKVRLIDMLGREIFAPEQYPEQTDFVLPFNRPTLSAGQYIILIEAQGDVLSQKMIVK